MTDPMYCAKFIKSLGTVRLLRKFVGGRIVSECGRVFVRPYSHEGRKVGDRVMIATLVPGPRTSQYAEYKLSLIELPKMEGMSADYMRPKTWFNFSTFIIEEAKPSSKKFN